MKTPNVAIGSIAETYSGIYLRSHLESQGTVPGAAGPPPNLCPDIIHSDCIVPDAAQQFATPQSWSQMYASDPTLGVTNYYYVRGKNGSTAPVTGRMSLYWASAQVFNLPSVWARNELTIANDLDYTPVSAAGGQIAVGTEPFVWAPGYVPAGGSYFNFVCRSVDAANPNPIPTLRTWTDLAHMLTNPGLGFRNTVIVDGGATTTWQHQQTLSVPRSFQPVTAYLTLAGQGFAGATVSLLCSDFSPSGEIIQISPQPMPAEKGQFVGTYAALGPGFQTSLIITCSNNSVLAPGSILTLSVICPIPDAELEFALAHGLARYYPDARIAPTPIANVANITFMVGAETQSARLR